MPKDPVCGMRVAQDAPLRAEHGGETYRFCSEHCLHKFNADPAPYVGTAPTEVASPPRPDLEYTCPMHPQVRRRGPGSCPKCGMALEPAGPPVAARAEYVCPMHPEVVQDRPGNCPKCRMALEPRTVDAEEDDSELRDMSRRFRVSAVLAIPVFFSAMAAEIWPEQMAAIVDPKLRQWLELILATPVVVWGGWPFYVRALQSLITRNLNMFTLIGLGVSVAWGYSPCHYPHLNTG